jgi:hypothetical protein
MLDSAIELDINPEVVLTLSSAFSKPTKGSGSLPKNSVLKFLSSKRHPSRRSKE